jgi:hypothetical protein
MNATTVLDTNPADAVHEASDLSDFQTGVTSRTPASGNMLTIDPAEVDLKTLSSSGDNAADTLMEARSHEANYPALESYTATDETLKKAGVVQCASFARHPGGTGTVRLEFNGNNLDKSHDPAIIEFTFSAARLDDPALAEINSMIKDVFSTHKNQALRQHVNILEHEGVSLLLKNLAKKKLSITNLHLENTLLEADKAGRSSLLQNAVLGGITPYEAALEPARIHQRPALVNAIVRDIKLGGISGRMKSSLISGVDLSAGHIEVFTDVRSRIEKVSAIGSTLAGEINCPISGDFRRAMLGTKQQPLSGTAFQTHEGLLVPSRKVSAFVFDTAKSDGKAGIVINQEFSKLDTYHARKRFHQVNVDNLRRLRNDFFIQPSIDTADAFSQSLESFSTPLQQGRVALANGRREAVFEFSESSEETPLPAVSLTVTNGADWAPGISIDNLLPERALYVLKQLDRMHDDRATLCYHNYNNEELRWNDTATAPKAAPRKEKKERGTRLSIENSLKVGVLGRDDD